MHENVCVVLYSLYRPKWYGLYAIMHVHLYRAHIKRVLNLAIKNCVYNYGAIYIVQHKLFI